MRIGRAGNAACCGRLRSTGRESTAGRPRRAAGLRSRRRPAGRRRAPARRGSPAANPCPAPTADARPVLHSPWAAAADRRPTSEACVRRCRRPPALGDPAASATRPPASIAADGRSRRWRPWRAAKRTARQHAAPAAAAPAFASAAGRRRIPPVRGQVAGAGHGRAPTAAACTSPGTRTAHRHRRGSRPG